MVSQAKKNKAQSKAQWNDPKKVDSLFGWLILMGFGGLTFVALAMNIGPYTTFLSFLIKNAAPWWIGVMSGILGFPLGILLLVSVQLGEIKPLLMIDSRPEKYSHEWRRVLFGWCMIAAACYAIDAAFCAAFWPPLTVPFQQFRYAPTLSSISWWNICIAGFTLFGLSAYVSLWRFIRRIM